MKTTMTLALLALASCSLALAKSDDNSKKKDPVVMTIDGRDVTRSEFEYFYTKNNQQDVAEEKTFDEYVDLFINYKLKVAEAYAQGVDTLKSYQDELAGYRQQLVEPYLTMPGWADSLINEVAERRQYEVHASHILIQVPAEAPDSVSEKARKTLDSLKVCIEGGQKFDSLARIFSQDPSAKQNAGDLGYFTSMQMVYPFEKAAFETPVGGVTLVRSGFGWHLIKVFDKRKTQGEVRVAHIMKMFQRGMNPAQRASIKTQMDSIYRALKGGADFAKMAADESEDQYTAKEGGAYPWIDRSARFPGEWLDVAYRLEKDAVSEPFMTQFGWHIMKKLDARETQELTEEQKGQMAQQFAHDKDRQEAGKVALAKTLRQQWSKDKMLKKLGVASWSDEQILKYRDEHLVEQEEEFAHLYKEYHDGIMLFEVSSKAVWDKAQQDTVGLNAFFERNRAKYDWDQPHFKGAFIECADDPALVAKLKDIYDHNDYVAAAELVKREVLTDTLLTPDPKKPRFHIVNGLYNPGDNATVDQQQLGRDVKVTPKSSMPVQMTYGRVLPTGPEMASDIRGQVVGDYQNELEEQWVAMLREKFTYSINQKQLDAVKADNSK